MILGELHQPRKLQLQQLLFQSFPEGNASLTRRGAVTSLQVLPLASVSFLQYGLD